MGSLQQDLSHTHQEPIKELYFKQQNNREDEKYIKLSIFEKEPVNVLEMKDT